VRRDVDVAAKLPRALRLSLEKVAGYLVYSIATSNVAKGSGQLDYGDLLLSHREAALLFLAQRVEQLTSGKFTVREGHPRLFRQRDFSRQPLLYLVVCSPEWAEDQVVAFLNHDDDMRFFIPVRKEPSDGLLVCVV
jgi:hypothetical protein